VIPKPIHEKYDLKPGTTVTFGIEDGEVVIRGSERVLEEYLTAIPKREEPDEIDWDTRHYERFERRTIWTATSASTRRCTKARNQPERRRCWDESSTENSKGLPPASPSTRGRVRSIHVRRREWGSTLKVRLRLLVVSAPHRRLVI
jgi:bifunctional DNA-binding transcriptional regulator/antitoxin component of YhaV-PrlF toxin-antitoxin module